ncbi:MAG: SIS domain-containing protein [Acidobacteriota bacterium]|nr:SIS domain-containing protein [Acidobacteriota bacterium]
MTSFVHDNIREATAVLESLADLEVAVGDAVSLIHHALTTGHKLLTCGNGGSAADAAHLSTEFVGRFDRDRRPYPAICLAAHAGNLTAIANDYAFNDVFSRQVEGFGNAGDILIVFSSTGQSENVYRALTSADRLGINTIALLGREGGRCAGRSTVELIVRSNSTARIQEAHKFLLHTICELVESELAQNSNPSS